MDNGEGRGTTRSGLLRYGGRTRLASDVQVLIGVGSLLALLAVAVGLAVLLIVSFEDDATGETHEHTLYATNIHEAALYAKSLANHQRGFLLSGKRVYTDEIAEETTEARQRFANAATYAVSRAQQDAVRTSGAQFERWHRAMLGDLDTYRRGDHQKAITDSLGPTRQLRKRYAQSLAHAYDLGVTSFERSTDSLSTSATRSVTFLLGYLAVALLVGIAVALWVVRAILRPAFTLSQNAIEVLTQGQVLVNEDERGSHHGVAVVVPIEVVNALAESALETQESLKPTAEPAA